MNYQTQYYKGIPLNLVKENTDHGKLRDMLLTIPTRMYGFRTNIWNLMELSVLGRTLIMCSGRRREDWKLQELQGFRIWPDNRLGASDGIERIGGLKTNEGINHTVATHSRNYSTNRDTHTGCCMVSRQKRRIKRT